MTLATPITTPARVLAAALHGPLSGVVPSFGGIPAWFWLRSTDAAAAALQNRTLAGLIVVQPQTPLREDSMLNLAEVTGSITVRCHAHSNDAAQTLLADAAAALLDGLTPPEGYEVHVSWTGEVTIPPAGEIWVAAATFAAAIRRVPPPAPATVTATEIADLAGAPNP